MLISAQLMVDAIPAAFLGTYLGLWPPHYFLGFLVFLFFVFWVFLCALVGLYAGTKGRSGVWFFILSVFLSPLIGFLIALAMHPQQAKIAQHSA